jgi:hypothetical protein
MYLELFQDMLWFHTDVHKWSQEVKKDYLKDLDALQELVGIPLVALVEEDDIKLSKFGEVTGWKVMNKLNLNNGKVGLVYTRSRNG